MKNMQLYIGGVNDITYRYDIQKAGDIFNVRIFNVKNHTHIEVGMKTMHSITAHDAVDECLSHYKIKAKSLSNFFGFFGCRNIH